MHLEALLVGLDLGQLGAVGAVLEHALGDGLGELGKKGGRTLDLGDLFHVHRSYIYIDGINLLEFCLHSSYYKTYFLATMDIQLLPFYGNGSHQHLQMILPRFNVPCMRYKFSTFL